MTGMVPDVASVLRIAHQMEQKWGIQSWRVDEEAARWVAVIYPTVPYPAPSQGALGAKVRPVTRLGWNGSDRKQGPQTDTRDTPKSGPGRHTGGPNPGCAICWP